jgi:hypothetical protein
MRGAAEFYLDWLVEDGQGRLVTAPGTSPEQGFKTPEGRRASVAIAPTMDLAIIWDLFTNVLEAARVLKIEDAFTARVAAARARLLPPGIDERGRLREWAHDLPEEDEHHRHVSHLFGVHPGRQITPARPELYAAARRSLEIRGDEGTGWSLGWKLNLWARFREGDDASEEFDPLTAHRVDLRPWRDVRHHANSLAEVTRPRTSCTSTGRVMPFNVMPPTELSTKWPSTAAAMRSLTKIWPSAASAQSRAARLVTVPIAA